MRLCFYLLLLFFLVLATACTEEIDRELLWEEASVMVVEGKLTNETRAHEVKLSWPMYEINGTPGVVSGAYVDIFDGTKYYPFTEDPLHPGTYLSEASLAGKVGQTYQLRIAYEDFRIRGACYMREVEDFPNMSIYKVQQDPVLYEAYIGDQYGPAVIRLELDWSHVSGYESLPPEENHALIYHYTLGGVDVNHIFSPQKEKVRFPAGTIACLEKESVSLAYMEFLRGMLSETDWRGGVFDVQPGNARSNLKGRAVGYFTAAAVIRDTIIVR